MRGRAAQLLAVTLGLAAAAGTLAATSAASGEADVRLKAGPGRAAAVSGCVICHSLEYIPANAPAMDRAAWQKTVQKMRERFGAPLTDEQAKQILDYLSTEYSGKS